MKRSVFVISMVFISFASLGQVTYFDTNNFFLHYFTDTGFSRYDWRFEPLKTDKERGNLKGDIVKVVTNITDKTGRGYGDNFTDTTYYNPDGNIKKIVALKRDEFDPKKIFRPDVWLYEYDKEGGLNGYTKLSQVEVWGGGKEMRKEVHTTVHNSQGKIIKEVSNTFSQHNNKWEAIGESNVIWAFAYDTAGNLVSGKGPLNTSLSYKNGQLTKMQEATEQPVTYTYDAVGHLVTFKYYLVDGMDEVYYNELSSTMTYNEHGDICKAVKATWNCNSKWQRHKRLPSEVFTITYTYDEKGNWTKAVAYSKFGTDPRRLAFSIERTITYGHVAASCNP